MDSFPSRYDLEKLREFLWKHFISIFQSMDGCVCNSSGLSTLLEKPKDFELHRVHIRLGLLIRDDFDESRIHELN